MPKLNSNEKRLLLIFGSVAFLAANVFGYLLISAFMKGLEAEEVKLKARLNGPDGLENAKAKAADADAKRDWIDKNLLAYPNEEYRETYLDNIVNAILTANLDVELSKSSTMPTITGEYFIKSRFRTNVKGPWQDVKEFIYRLQKPEDFRFVPRLSMVPRKNELDDSKQLVEVSLEIEKWWPKPDSFEDTETVTPEIEQPAGDAVQPPAGDAIAPPSIAAPATTTDPPPAEGTTTTEPSPAVVTPPPPQPATSETPTDPAKPNL